MEEIDQDFKITRRLSTKLASLHFQQFCDIFTTRGTVRCIYAYVHTNDGILLTGKMSLFILGIVMDIKRQLFGIQPNRDNKPVLIAAKPHLRESKVNWL